MPAAPAAERDWPSKPSPLARPNSATATPEPQLTSNWNPETGPGLRLQETTPTTDLVSYMVGSRSGNEHFSKDRRMRAAADFDAAFKHRTMTIKAGSFRIIVRSNEAPEARLGLIVAKRVFPRAADRNRIKRLVRESFRRRAAELPRVDLVVQALSRDMLDQLPQAFEKALDRVAQKAI